MSPNAVAATTPSLAVVAEPQADLSDRATRTLGLLEQAANADEATAERLREEAVLLNIDVAESIALRYRSRGVAEEDLVQTAHLGLVKAARAFDPAKSANFLAFAVPTMR